MQKTFFITTTRLENFSDGVFTIVLTLLAFQFKVPKFSTTNTNAENLQELLKISPYLIGFVFSFLFVAVFWANHHNLYHTIKEANSKLLWLNIHSLFWVTMMPFAIAIVGDFHKVPLAAIFLGTVLFMASVTAYMLLRYSHVNSKLVDETLSDSSIKYGQIKNIVAIIFTLIGILSAIWSVYASYSIYVLVLGIFIVPQKLEKQTKSDKRKKELDQTNNNQP